MHNNYEYTMLKTRLLTISIRNKISRGRERVIIIRNLTIITEVHQYRIFIPHTPFPIIAIIN